MRRADIILDFLGQVNVLHTKSFGFNVIIKCLFRAGDFRITLKDYIGRLTHLGVQGPQAKC